MYLQLAENAEPEAKNPYIYLPDPTGRTKAIRVREDLFDDLDEYDYYKLMRELAPFQEEVRRGLLSEGQFLADRASRRARRERKKGEKEEKKKLKNEKREAKNEIKRARAEAKKEGRGGRVLDSVMQAVGGIVGKKFGGEEVYDEYEELPPEPEKKTNYMPWVLGGIGVLALGGIAYAMSRQSKTT